MNVFYLPGNMIFYPVSGHLSFAETAKPFVIYLQGESLFAS